MASNLLTDKTRMAALIKKKKECDKLALEVVVKLIEPGITKEFLIENSLRISPHHYEDVVEERRISGLCGWTLCNQKLDLKTLKAQQFVIRGKRVLDITKRKSFCSAGCYGRSTHFLKQLPTSPLWMREEKDAVYPEVLENDEDLVMHGISVKLAGVNIGGCNNSSSSSSSEDD